MERKWTHVLFAVGGVVLAWLLTKTGEWVWSYFGKPNSFAVGTGAFIVAGVATFILWRNEQVFGLAQEVTTELRKVTWPSRKEVYSTTIVVIVTSVLFGFYLWGLDLAFSRVMSLVLAR